MHWACSKITSSLNIPDVTLLEILLDKVFHDWRSVQCFFILFIAKEQLLNYASFDSQLKMCKGISYAAVAAHADKNGRRKLAAMLVEHEPRSSKQVFCFTGFSIDICGRISIKMFHKI